jgi:hypothetical protein
VCLFILFITMIGTARGGRGWGGLVAGGWLWRSALWQRSAAHVQSRAGFLGRATPAWLRGARSPRHAAPDTAVLTLMALPCSGEL